MSDLLGSILDNMTAPPSNNDKNSIRRKRALKRQREEEAKKRAAAVRDVQQKVNQFVESSDPEFSFPPSEREWRAIQHEMSEIAGLISVSCYNGPNEEKHVTVFKKDHCPSEEEIKKRRLGENYIEGYKKSVAGPSSSRSQRPAGGGRQGETVVPSRNYQDKYKKFLHTLEVTEDSRQYHGLVPVHMLCTEPKSIEDSLNEIRSKKRLKTENAASAAATSSDKT